MMNQTKHILLCQHGGSANHGCEALARTVYALLQECGCRVSLYSYSAADDRSRLQDLPKLQIEGLDRLPGRYSASNLHYHARRMLGLRASKLPITSRFRTLVAEADLVIAIGGDNYCYHMGQGYWALDHYIKSAGKPYVLLGCSIEPDDLPHGLAAHLRLFDLITVRERISFDAMRESGLDNIAYAPDSAFLLPKAAADLPAGLIPEQAVGLNFSPLVMQNEQIPGMTLRNFERLAQDLLTRTQLQLALIPHVVRSDSDDRRALRLLYEKLKTEPTAQGRVFLVEDQGAEQLKGLISRLVFFVGARTHATIAAYSSGVPTLVLGYSVKARGIARDLFGTEQGYVIPVQKLEQENQLSTAFWQLFAQREQMAQQLQGILPDYRAAAKGVVSLLQQVLQADDTAYAFRLHDDALRRKSSSGAAFSALATQTFAAGGVVFGAAFDKEMRLRHRMAENEEQLIPLRGSKYLYSDLDGCLQQAKEMLSAGRQVLFSGLPCQAAAARKALGDDARLLIAEVVCHGAPEPVWFAHYCRELAEDHGSALIHVDFRDKSSGWHDYAVRYAFADGSELRRPAAADPYLRLFLQDLTLREACYSCPFKRNSTADLTLGDLWGAKALAPALADDIGVSLVVPRTPAGYHALETLFATNQADSTPVSRQKAAVYNPCLIRPVVRPRQRDAFREKAAAGMRIDALAAAFLPQPNARQRLRGIAKKLLRG